MGEGARENRGQESTGGGRREGGKRDSQRGGNQKKRRKILQYCIKFYNRNRTKMRETLWKEAESGSNRYGRWEFQTPPSPSTGNDSE